MNELSRYYQAQAEAQPEPSLVAALPQRHKRRPMRLVPLCVVLALLVSVMTAFAVSPELREFTRTRFINLITGEPHYFDYSRNDTTLSVTGEELLEKYRGLLNNDRFAVNASLTIRKTGDHSVMWSIISDALPPYRTAAAFYEAVQDNCLPLIPIDQLPDGSAFVGNQFQSLYNAEPAEIWEESGYTLELRHSGDPRYNQMIVDITNTAAETVLTYNAFLRWGDEFEVPDTIALQQVSVAQWPYAFGGTDSETGDVHLYLHRSLPADDPDANIVPQYDMYRVACELTSQTLTLDELVALAETMA